MTDARKNQGAHPLQPQEDADMADTNNKITDESNPMYLPIHNRAASAYTRVGVETSVLSATPHDLISLLFAALLDNLAAAKSAMERNDVPQKGKTITKAIRLLNEGLKGGLSPEGGDLTSKLSALYDYCVSRLMHANVTNDLAAIDEVRELIEPVADAWKTIRNQTNQGQ